MHGDVAVICASPPGINPGMDSVDRAFLYLANKYQFQDRIRFYHLYPASRASDDGGQGSISYSVIPSTEAFFRSHQVIIYWGDFLHMRQYHQGVARRLVQSGLSKDLETAQLRAREVFLQSGEELDTLGKSLTFGSTLIFNTLSDEMHAAYHAALARFLKFCRAAWFRDVYSAFKACQIRGVFEPNCLGIDCANLIDPDQVYPLASRPVAADQVGIFLGRTGGNIEAMVQFAFEVTKGLGCKPAWLRWGDSYAFPALAAIFQLAAIRSLEAFSEQPASQARDSIAELLKYRAIVTDTYHVCVNAWNLGVPAICLVQTDFSRPRNVNFGDSFARRDKRQVFMSMYDALEFLVSGDELASHEFRKARILRLLDLLHSGRAIAAIQSRIRSHAGCAETSLMQVLAGLL